MLARQIERHFPHLTDQQKAIIAHLTGQLLIIAGPGSGKTLTLVLRALNLIITGHVAPGQLVLCTFSQKAATELHDRFHHAGGDARYLADLSQVRITTIHSLCNDILRRHRRELSLPPDYGLLNDLDQAVFINRRLYDVTTWSQRTLFLSRWRSPQGVVRSLRNRFNRIADELIRPDDLSLY